MADGGVVFLFDENSPHRLVRSLRELGEAAFHVYDVGLKQAPDEMVLRYAGEREWCIVSSDRNILHRPHERAVLKQFSIGAFFLNRHHRRHLQDRADGLPPLAGDEADRPRRTQAVPLPGAGNHDLPHPAQEAGGVEYGRPVSSGDDEGMHPLPRFFVRARGNDVLRLTLT
ncbi:MAG TPA: DUF5615 family PIN-like protein [Longimicrobium sp.]